MAEGDCDFINFLCLCDFNFSLYSAVEIVAEEEVVVEADLIKVIRASSLFCIKRKYFFVERPRWW